MQYLTAAVESVPFHVYRYFVNSKQTQCICISRILILIQLADAHVKMRLKLLLNGDWDDVVTRDNAPSPLPVGRHDRRLAPVILRVVIH